MSTENITPTTIYGIKRLAKSISKQDGVTHAIGLDRASGRAGYSNFTHAQRALASSATPPAPSFKTYISVRWRDPKTKAHGTEVIEISLPRPLDAVAETRHYKNARGLWNFKRWASDLIACQIIPQSQDNALSVACAAARTLQFMAATGLKPSASDAFPRGRGAERLPWRDHWSSWFDPATKKKVVIDEPYAAAIERHQPERDAWAEHNDWQIVKSAWAGIYYPDGGSELYLLSDNKRGLALEPIETALATLGAPIVPESCKRVTAKHGEPFRSPGEIRQQAEKVEKASKPKRARATGTTSKGVPYRMILASGTRPNAKMAIEMHSEVGKLLKDVLTATRRRVGVSKRVGQVRSKLDDWVQLEYDRTELSNDVFFDLYYHERAEVPEAEIGIAGRDLHLERLLRAKAILVKQYPDCKPLRDLVKKLDLAVKSLEAWR